MARKRKEVRLSESIALATAWSNSSFEGDKTHHFINDMVRKLERERGISPGQRRWLDSLIESGVPAVSDAVVDNVSAVEEAIKVFNDANPSDFAWEIGVLKDFRPRVAKNYNMSEKQQALLDRLVSEASNIRDGKHWNPTADERAVLLIATQLYKGYSAFWKGDRPGVRRAVEQIEGFLFLGTAFIRKKHAEKLLHAVRGRLKKFEKPRFTSGSLGKIPAGHAICTTDVYVSSHGNIVNDWLLPDGRLMTIDQENVKKR